MAETTTDQLHAEVLDAAKLDADLLDADNWTLLMRHNIAFGLFRNEELVKNPEDTSAPLYANISDMEYEPYCGKEGEFIFKIVWPTLFEDTGDERLAHNFMIWSQSSTPMQRIKDYKPIFVPYPGDERPDCEFSGVFLSDPRHGGIVDCNAASQWWHYAIAVKHKCDWDPARTGKTTSGIPGPTANGGRCYMVNCAELWIKRRPSIVLSLEVQDVAGEEHKKLIFTSLGGSEVACLTKPPETEDDIEALWATLADSASVPASWLTIVSPSGQSFKALQTGYVLALPGSSVPFEPPGAHRRALLKELSTFAARDT